MSKKIIIWSIFSLVFGVLAGAGFMWKIDQPLRVSDEQYRQVIFYALEEYLSYKEIKLVDVSWSEASRAVEIETVEKDQRFKYMIFNDLETKKFLLEKNGLYVEVPCLRSYSIGCSMGAYGSSR